MTPEEALAKIKELEGQVSTLKPKAAQADGLQVQLTEKQTALDASTAKVGELQVSLGDATKSRDEHQAKVAAAEKAEQETLQAEIDTLPEADKVLVQEHGGEDLAAQHRALKLLRAARGDSTGGDGGNTGDGDDNAPPLKKPKAQTRLANGKDTTPKLVPENWKDASDKTLADIREAIKRKQAS